VSRRFVSEHAGTYPVTRLCELVGVSRSSYYEWANRPLSAHYLDDVDLANEIHAIHVASRRTYGAPRVAGQLHNAGRHHGCKRVARIMAECGLVGVHGRKRWRRGKHDTAPAGDLLERDFTAQRSNQRWVADITEFRCRDGKLFLAGDQRSVRPVSRGLVDGRTPDHGPSRERARHGARASRTAR
jgi:putative transposase